jgi:hypothetical protein
MFKIQGNDSFTTTIGQLNFFRWALECKVLDYIEANQETIRTGYNAFLKETTAIQKKQKSETQSSTLSSSTSTVSVSSDELQTPSGPARITRRRRTKQTPSALRQLQISSNPITLEFN